MGIPYKYAVQFLYIASYNTPRGHAQPSIEPKSKPGASPEKQEGDDERVPTTPLQAGLPGLYVMNGRVDVVCSF